MLYRIHPQLERAQDQDPDLVIAFQTSKLSHECTLVENIHTIVAFSSQVQVLIISQLLRLMDFVEYQIKICLHKWNLGIST